MSDKKDGFHGYTLRFYPTADQERILAKTLGCCRFVWNQSLEYMDARFHQYGLPYSKKALDDYLLDLKARFPWLYDANANCLVQAQRDLNKAFRKYFAESAKPAAKKKPPRKDGRPHHYPRMKRRGLEGSCRFQMDYRNGRDHLFQPLGVVELTKELRIAPVWTQVPLARPRMVTVLRDPTGAWYLAFACDETGLDPARTPLVAPYALPAARALELNIFGRFIAPERIPTVEIFQMLRDSAFPSLEDARRALSRTGRHGEPVPAPGFKEARTALVHGRRRTEQAYAPHLAASVDPAVDAVLNAIRADVLANGRITEPYQFSLAFLKRLVRSPALRSLDLGLKEIVTLQDGMTFPDITAQLKALLRKQKQLATLQRGLERQRQHRKRGQPPSNRYLARKKRLARKHRQVAQSRRDIHDKLSDRLTGPGVALVCLENLFAKGMMQNARLAKHVQNMALGLLRCLITGKAKARRVAVLFCDRFAPSSKTCHVCGHHHADLALSDREWTCPDCGAALDRDLNAAVNIFVYSTGGQPGDYLIDGRGARRIGAVGIAGGSESDPPGKDWTSPPGSVKTVGVRCPGLSGGKQGC